MRKIKRKSRIIIAAAVIIAVTAVIVLLTMVTAKVYPKAPSIKRSELTDKPALGLADDYRPSEIKLPILMYHNIIPSGAGTKYEVTVDELRADFEAIKAKGFSVVSAESVIAYASGARIMMPERPIMLTFDDGFYNYNRFLTPLLREFGYSATVGVVGDFTRYNKNTDATPNYTYVDYDDIRELSEASVTIANHSAAMHYMKNGKKGVSPLLGESEDAYRERFRSDTLKMHENLSKIGIKPCVYVYPYGIFNKISEEVLTELEYSMTLTCSERVNTVVSGDRSCLRLMGRYNRDGRRPVEPLLNKFLKQ